MPSVHHHNPTTMTPAPIPHTAPLTLSATLHTRTATRRAYSLRLSPSPSPDTESLPPPCTFATSLHYTPPTPATVTLLHTSKPRSTLPLSPALLRHHAATGAPLTLHFPRTRISATLLVTPDLRALATRSLAVALASRGVVNAFCARYSPDVEALFSVRVPGQDAWQPFRRCGAVDAGAALSLRGLDRQVDATLVRVDALAVRGNQRVLWGSVVVPLSGMCEGARLSLRREELVVGVVAVRVCERGKAATQVVFEMFLDAGARR